MHPALFIDEILQLIFEAVLNDGKPSLCCAARCCRAWKDPALDRIWRRLPSAIPLLSLLPGFSMETDIIVGFSSPQPQLSLTHLKRLGPTTQDMSFTAFHSYSIRVKHIVHRHGVLVDSACIPMDLFHQLSNLESARIKSRATGEVALRMSLAPRLRALTLQVDYAKSTTSAHSMMSLLQECSSLEQLSVRGYSSEYLHIPLSKMTILRSLTLHLSSLTPQAFMSVSTLPLLVDFDVHADRLSHDDLSAAITRLCDASFFPALEQLKIRAQPVLAALVVQQLPRNKLHSLHMDATGPASSSAFEGLFQAMATLPLHEFILEDAISIDESEDMPTYTPDKVFTLEHLRPLSKVPLRRLILDTSLPPDLSDPGIGEMTKWWPLLEQLELGATTALENAETWKPRTSLASLAMLARGCKHLQSLAIVLDADSLPESGPVPLVPHPLTSLSISSRSRPDIPSLSTLLCRLFPSLVDVTPGFVGEHEDAWAVIQAALIILLEPYNNLQPRKT